MKMANAIHQGIGAGLSVMSYEDINELRLDTINIENFIRVKRGQLGLTTVFRNILPPTVRGGDLADIEGCGKIADPSCLTEFEFTASVNKYREINEYIPDCDWSKLDSLTDEYLFLTAQEWALDEFEKVVDWLKATLPQATAVTPTPTSERVLIEKLVQQAEAQLLTDMGKYKAKRSEMIILLGANHESALRLQGMNCCNPRDAIESGHTNFWGVRAVYNIDTPILDGNDIIIYVPRLKFMVTTCKKDPKISPLFQDNREADAARVYGRELYGFEEYNVGKKDDLTVNVVHAGIRASVAPIEAPATSTTGAQVLSNTGEVIAELAKAGVLTVNEPTAEVADAKPTGKKEDK